MKRELQVGDIFSVKTDENPRLWVVISTKWTGGGTAHGPHDIYPNGHYVRARKLTPTSDGNVKYNPKGKIRGFYQSGCFNGMIYPKDVMLMGKMHQTFVMDKK